MKHPRLTLSGCKNLKIRTLEDPISFNIYQDFLTSLTKIIILKPAFCLVQIIECLRISTICPDSLDFIAFSQSLPLTSKSTFNAIKTLQLFALLVNFTNILRSYMCAKTFLLYFLQFSANIPIQWTLLSYFSFDC